ncbi:hypothetical protein FM113_11735 [Leucobacter sp. 7(1)]|uniref:hypothetical protein n=1 Tax=Leucobacter sp. 7(1) TaxID=1255613 RepID=UPI00097E97A1|nr:hypothetical protein [Leucobacter sp. 7(1)]SJN11357.1 hypothetical protein FM113_11735 [Leucobacter sp. 7(1)]
MDWNSPTDLALIPVTILMCVLLVFTLIGLWGNFKEWQRKRQAVRVSALEAELDRTSEELRQTILSLAAELDHNRNEAIRQMCDTVDSAPPYEIRR